MSAASRGIIVDATDARLVIEASPQQVAQFAVGASVAVSAAPWMQRHAAAILADLYAHPFLYDQQGRRIAVVTNVASTNTWLDVTTFGEQFGEQFVPGLLHYAIRAEGPA